MDQNPFFSFWMAGYECSDKLNAFGNRVDFLSATGHLELLYEDYRNLEAFNIKTVREGIRWSQVEKKPYEYDFRTVGYMMDCAEELGIQQVWDICHFGFPDDLTPLHPYFPRRFAALCRAFTEFYRSKNKNGVLIVTPINEVSFLSWLGGEVRGTSPYCVGQGWEVKYRLMKAYLEGVIAMKEVDPSVRILTTEPLISRVPPLNANAEQIAEVKRIHDHQFQIFEILGGNICPELGGRPEFLDMLGFNFYYDNQSEVGTWQILDWKISTEDPRWRTLSSLLKEMHDRYARPIVLSETSHPGIHRPQWIQMVAEECLLALQNGIPLWGVCLYPIIDRPDWDNLNVWHRSGLWDEQGEPGSSPKRIIHKPSAHALSAAQALIDAYHSKKELTPFLLNRREIVFY